MKIGKASGVLACWLTVASLAACGSSNSSPQADGSGAVAHAIDLGTSSKISVHTTKPRVAVFAAGTSNQYLKTWVSTAESYGKSQGISVTVFDGNFDAETQFNQMQNALQSKKFDAWVTIALDGNLECKILSQSAPAAGIVVLTADTPICDRATKPFADFWQPGTLAFVSAENSTDYLSGWLNDVAAVLHGSHNVALLTGPPAPVPTTVALNQAVAKFGPLNPNLHFVDTLSTDYTTADGLAKTRTILQSHPEVDTILSIYSDLTQGVIQALTQAGKVGKINVIDIGASTYSVGQVSQGHELFTVPYTPVDAALGAFKTLLAAFQTGVTPNRTIDVFPPSNGTVDKPLIIDKSNAATYQPQF